MNHVGIVEDDKNMLNIIVLVMQAAGFRTTSFQTFEQAAGNVDLDCDVWLLDIMLQKKSGLVLFQMIKEKHRNIPIIFISARDKEADRVLGLQIGSDDYITKPFSKRELVLRVNNVLRRTGKNSEFEKIVFGGYSVDRNAHTVKNSHGTSIDLTSKEFMLFITLLDNQGQVVERERLLKLIWDINYFGSGRVLDDTVRRLRKKMLDLKLETVYGEGYRLNAL